MGFVGPADALATVEWLYPQEQLAPERRPLHRFALALLRARAGRQEEALAALEPLQQELAASKQETRLSRATAQLLAQLRKLPGR